MTIIIEEKPDSQTQAILESLRQSVANALEKNAVLINMRYFGTMDRFSSVARRQLTALHWLHWQAR